MKYLLEKGKEENTLSNCIMQINTYLSSPLKMGIPFRVLGLIFRVSIKTFETANFPIKTS